MITINGYAVPITQFPDHTSQVWKLDEAFLRDGRPAYVEWIFENEGEVMHLAQLAALLRTRPGQRHLDIRYLPYARQDKMVANNATFALRVFAPILNLMAWDSVTLFDPHSEVALELIEKSRPSYFAHEAVRAMKMSGCDTICFPDQGALSKYKPLFWGHNYVSARKTRDQATGKITGAEISNDVHGLKLMIVDDICDGGATFINLAGMLRARGASDVCLFVSHGLFTRGVKVLKDAGISRVFTPKEEVFA